MPAYSTRPAPLVDQKTIPAIDEAVIGGQIRELRKVKGLTLQHVADAAGISVGYLSQIERNQSKLPIGVLRRICSALGVHMNWFFQITEAPDSEREWIVRASDRRRLSFTGTGVHEELLSPNLAGPLELLLSTLEPGADSGDYSHGGPRRGWSCPARSTSGSRASSSVSRKGTASRSEALTSTAAPIPATRRPRSPRSLRHRIT